MSSSSKKQLRAEQNAAKLTERQLVEQKEAKKVKIYTIVFVAAMAVILVAAIAIGVNQIVSGSGMLQRNTVALTVNDHALNNSEMSYYYMDAVNKFYNENGSYLSFYGLDASKPLDKQVFSEDDGTTWADYLMEVAKSNAKATYALVDAATAEGMTLTDEQIQTAESVESTFQLYALTYGYKDAASYLKALYGNGASMDGYIDYVKATTLAAAYQQAKVDSLTYTADQLEDAQAEDPTAYNGYTYNMYFLSANRFQTGGTTNEDGTTVYSQEEKDAAAAAAKEAADSLVSEKIDSVEALDAAIAALPINEGTAVSSSAYTAVLPASINSQVSPWITDAARTEGDLTVIPSTVSSTDDDGNQVTTTNGYYVVYFIGSTDNRYNTVNVRHILVNYDTNAEDVEAAKATAKDKAEELLSQWHTGEETEERFAALATANSADTGSAANGGLYENVYQGEMVPAFNDWCFDESRKSGDTDIVETNYGFHVMYFVGTSDVTYRDFMIENNLKTADMNQWYTDLVDAAQMTDGNTRYINTGVILQRG